MNTIIRTSPRLNRSHGCHLPHFACRADSFAAPPDPPGALHASPPSSS